MVKAVRLRPLWTLEGLNNSPALSQLFEQSCLSLEDQTEEDGLFLYFRCVPAVALSIWLNRPDLPPRDSGNKYTVTLT